jgi:hypothetical protein
MSRESTSIHSQAGGGIRNTVAVVQVVARFAGRQVACEFSHGPSTGRKSATQYTDLAKADVTRLRKNLQPLRL